MLKYFTPQDFFRSETATKNKILNVPKSFEIMDNLMFTLDEMVAVRNFLSSKANHDCPIYINSWFRCLELNRLVGSKKTSQHRKGLAIDWTSPKFGTPRAICEALKDNVNYDQLINEGLWVHISFKKSGNRNQFLDLS